MPQARAIRGGWFPTGADGESQVNVGDVVDGSAADIARWADEGLVEAPRAKPTAKPRKAKK